MSEKWRRRLWWAWLALTAVWLALAWWAIAPIAAWRMANRDLMFTYSGRTVLVSPSVDANVRRKRDLPPHGVEIAR